jgi:hypothetical protein
LLTNINTPANAEQDVALRAAMDRRRRLHCSTGTVGKRELMGKMNQSGMDVRIPSLKHFRGPSS